MLSRSDKTVTPTGKRTSVLQCVTLLLYRLD